MASWKMMTLSDALTGSAINFTIDGNELSANPNPALKFEWETFERKLECGFYLQKMFKLRSIETLKWYCFPNTYIIAFSFGFFTLLFFFY